MKKILFILLAGLFFAGCSSSSSSGFYPLIDIHVIQENTESGPKVFGLYTLIASPYDNINTPNVLNASGYPYAMIPLEQNRTYYNNLSFSSKSQIEGKLDISIVTENGKEHSYPYSITISNELSYFDVEEFVLNNNKEVEFKWKEDVENAVGYGVVISQKVKNHYGYDTYIRLNLEWVLNLSSTTTGTNKKYSISLEKIRQLYGDEYDKKLELKVTAIAINQKGMYVEGPSKIIPVGEDILVDSDGPMVPTSSID